MRLRFLLWPCVGLFRGLLGAHRTLGGFLGVKWLLAWCGIPHDGLPFLKFRVWTGDVQLQKGII